MEGRFRAAGTRSLPVLAIGVRVFAAAVLVVRIAGAAELSVGDPAPEFALPGTDGTIHRLGDSVGARGVVLAWFPKAFTPG
jgi:peroxiredoxin Q/BCP